MKLSAAILCLAAVPAIAQLNTYDLVVSNPVSPLQPSATVELWARFDPQWYAFGGALLDVVATPDPGGFSDPELILNNGGGPDPGEVTPEGDSILGVIVGQICDPIAGIYPDPANPILLWRVTWSTTDFTSREIPISTMTSKYELYTAEDCSQDSFLHNNFSEAFGAITVVPAPGVIPLLLIGGAVIGRRQR
jgi:hypothetical protein